MESRKSFEARLKYKMAPHLIGLVMDAYNFSKYGHRGQFRDSSERYFEHPRRVAIISIDELRIYDHEAIVAALLHDIEEDSYILSWDRIQKDFGDRVLAFVKLLTKKPGQSLEEYLANLQKAEEIVQLLKLADRLDNIRDLKGCTEAKSKKQLKETAERFIPWAKKLGDESMRGKEPGTPWTPQYALYSALKVAYAEQYSRIYNPTGT
ncbi:HD domain-containing protein [Patescibacteria group bacterium]|nr:HD domain-containing protein [Patescibacteria group bacterium]